MPKAVIAHTQITASPGPHSQHDFDSGTNTSTAWTVSREHDEHECSKEVHDVANMAISTTPSNIQDDSHESILVSPITSSLSLSSSFTTVGPPHLSPSSSSSSGNRPSTPPLLGPQNTSEWISSALTSFPLEFSTIRRSVLGGKSLNRFSSFVTSGAEEWILKGCESDSNMVRVGAHIWNDLDRNSSDFDDEHGEEEMLDDGSSSVTSRTTLRRRVRASDIHYIESGPTWKTKVPEFRVLVHSPHVRQDRSTDLNKGAEVGTEAYTVYLVSSTFGNEEPTSASGVDEGELSLPAVLDPYPPEPVTLIVPRRFTHFVLLHTALTRRLPGLALPPLPPKRYSGRFSSAFVEARTSDLQKYLNKLVRHPVARYAEILMAFLSCENDKEWARIISRHLSLPASGPLFYAHVYHPHFNLDAEDATEAVERFDEHVKAVGRGLQDLRGVYARVRDARVEMCNAERLLSYSLLSLITPTPLELSSRQNGDGYADQDDDEYQNDSNSAQHKKHSSGRKKLSGLMNSDGAWCWREDCLECLTLTKNIQRTAVCLQKVATLYDHHARRTMLASHEALKDVAHPSIVYTPTMDTHKSALSRYKEANEQYSSGNEDIASRCETVLNTTMAEFDTYHTQKKQDFEQFMREHLDGEIELYEKILTRLRTARQAFDAPRDRSLADSNKSRVPSIYERTLPNAFLPAPPLPQPGSHVFD